MNSENQEVGAFETKTRLAELLRETERGRTFTILRRGKPVAQLCPPPPNQGSDDLATLLTAFHKIRDRVKSKVNVRALIEKGRRH